MALILREIMGEGNGAGLWLQDGDVSVVTFSQRITEDAMPITIHPRKGQLLLADFEPGFVEPEMIKRGRPVIVLSNPIPGRSGLVTVVACSTVEPELVRNYHYKLPRASMPNTSGFQTRDTWVKGDMVYTLGFHRLNLIKLPKMGASGSITRENLVPNKCKLSGAVC